MQNLTGSRIENLTVEQKQRFLNNIEDLLFFLAFLKVFNNICERCWKSWWRLFILIPLDQNPKWGLMRTGIQIRIQNTQFNMLAALLDSSRLKKTIFQQFLNFDQKGTLETIWSLYFHHITEDLKSNNTFYIILS